MELIYRVNTASRNEIYTHLLKCDQNFSPALSSRTNLSDYSSKIFKKATSFEAWDQKVLVGMINAYLNDARHQAGFITNVSIFKDYMGKGVASVLLGKCLEHARRFNFSVMKLEVSSGNDRALKLYLTAGFKVANERSDAIVLEYSLIQ